MPTSGPVRVDEGPASRTHLTAALGLAQAAVGLSDPNPRVGCVITAADGITVLGRGHTQAAGSAHAEVMALRDALSRGFSVRGATAYVSLEPCCHHGRTPPCCEALITAGIAHVVAAVADPNPAVRGQGMARLRAAGLTTAWGPPDLAEASRELNIGFFSRMERGRSWVRLKVAASLDGRSALENGVSQWITGEAARTDGHAWRKRAGAILCGVGTVLHDDPRLNVRRVPTAKQPLRALIDARLDTPVSARIFDVPQAPLRFYAAAPLPERAAALAERGAELTVLPGHAGTVDLAAVLADLSLGGINEVHVEAGERLNGSLLREGLVDELLLYVAPVLMGAGRGLAHLGPFPSLAQALRFRLHSVDRVGEDLRLLLRTVSD